MKPALFPIESLPLRAVTTPVAVLVWSGDDDPSPDPDPAPCYVYDAENGSLGYGIDSPWNMREHFLFVESIAVDTPELCEGVARIGDRETGERKRFRLRRLVVE